MSLLNMAASLFMKKLSGGEGAGLSIDSVMPALKSLLPTNGDDLDLGGMVSMLGSSGLASLASSFLGDGKNESFSPTQLLSVLGDSKVSEFASNLGLQKETAASGLSSMIPDLIDQQSKGGSLTSGGLAGAAKSMLGGLFK